MLGQSLKESTFAHYTGKHHADVYKAIRKGKPLPSAITSDDSKETAICPVCNVKTAHQHATFSHRTSIKHREKLVGDFEKLRGLITNQDKWNLLEECVTTYRKVLDARPHRTRCQHCDIRITTLTQLAEHLDAKVHVSREQGACIKAIQNGEEPPQPLYEILQEEKEADRVYEKAILELEKLPDAAPMDL